MTSNMTVRLTGDLYICTDNSPASRASHASHNAKRKGSLPARPARPE